jgi:hypothetical protein
MPLKTYCLMALLLFSSGGFADQLALEDAAKQLMKDSAQSAAPAEAAETLDSANRSVEKAKNLKESMERAPASLQEQPAGAAGQMGGAKPSGIDSTQEAAPSEQPKATGPAKATEKPRQSKRQHR